MATRLRRMGQDLSKLEKYSLVSGLSINFFFVFDNAKMERKLVQVVSRFQPSSPESQTVDVCIQTLS